ncbi:MAG: hypothetical protein U5K36_16005 [Roseovarius sp.]|nr:hypothetical protein [Roseovarius sp.]
MSKSLDILVLGAAYGLLPAVRMCLGGHRVTIVCRADEREALDLHGASVTLQRRDGRQGRTLRAPASPGPCNREGVLGLVGTDISADGFDMVFLVMGEPQYADRAVANLMAKIADRGVPTVSLMNLLPACFLRRPGWFNVDVDALRPAYAAWDVWQGFDPTRFTAASPDAQAVRTHPERTDMLTVTLASNFKVAPFHDPADQAMLENVAKSTARIAPADPSAPARIVVQDSLAVPLSKWPMLITGNCRCLHPDGSVTSIASAVGDRMNESREIYDHVARVAMAAGASRRDIVPFRAYAAAARQLTRPSSLARALANGAQQVERVDLMILLAAEALDLRSGILTEISHIIARVLARNAS